MSSLPVGFVNSVVPICREISLAPRADHRSDLGGGARRFGNVDAAIAALRCRGLGRRPDRQARRIRAAFGVDATEQLEPPPELLVLLGGKPP
jgi:hypothetical protein